MEVSERSSSVSAFQRPLSLSFMRLTLEAREGVIDEEEEEEETGVGLWAMREEEDDAALGIRGAEDVGAGA